MHDGRNKNNTTISPRNDLTTQTLGDALIVSTAFESGTPVRDELLIFLPGRHIHDTAKTGGEDDGFQNEDNENGNQVTACNAVIANGEYHRCPWLPLSRELSRDWVSHFVIGPLLPTCH